MMDVKCSSPRIYSQKCVKRMVCSSLLQNITSGPKILQVVKRKLIGPFPFFIKPLAMNLPQYMYSLTLHDDNTVIKS